MRTWSVFLLLLATSVAGCLDDVPGTTPAEETQDPAPEDGLGPGNETLYLHAETDDAPAPAPTPPATLEGLGPDNGTLYLHAVTDTWMDTQPDGGDTIRETVTAAGGATVHRFPLRPSPERDVLLASTVSVQLDTTTSQIVGGSPVYDVSLYVNGVQAGRTTSPERSLTLDSGGEWPAGAEVELRVCVCPASGSLTYTYELATDGGSRVTLSFPGGATGSPSGGQSGGEVVVSQQGGRWVAARTLSFTDAAAERATVDMGTANGALTVTPGQGETRLVATLKAYGDSEQAARQRLEGMGVDQRASTSAGVLDYYAHGTVPDGQWNNRSITLQLSLPSVLDTLDLSTSNGAVDVGALTGGDWDISTSNGAIELDGATARRLEASTSNGRISLDATLDELDATSSNGQIEANLRAAASGSWSFQTSNGAIDLTVVEDSGRGYDVTARTTNGVVSFDFQDTEPVGQQSSKSKHERTTGYDGRAVQTTVTLGTTNGSIEAGS